MDLSIGRRWEPLLGLGQESNANVCMRKSWSDKFGSAQQTVPAHAVSVSL